MQYWQHILYIEGMIMMSLWMGRILVRFLVQASLVLLASSLTHAAKIVYVDVSAGSNTYNGLSWGAAKKTVTAGIGAAVNGDQVWVAQGTYVERITLKNGVLLYGGFPVGGGEWASRNVGAHETTLDGGQGGDVVTAPSSVTATARIDGFTIRNGSCGILCSNSSPIIANNIIRENTSTSGGIYASGGSPAITGNIITANSHDGMRCSSGSAVITGNTVHDNGGRGISAGSTNIVVCNNQVYGQSKYDGIYIGTSTGLVANNVVWDNYRAIESRGMAAIVNNTIISHRAEGLYVYAASGSPTIANNIAAFNGVGIAANAQTILTKNCIYGNTVANYQTVATHTTDLSVDPKLAAYEFGQYHLLPDSPCVNSGDNSVVQDGWTDMDGQSRVYPVAGAVDIGADESYGEPRRITPRVVRVAPTGSDGNDGSAWGDDHAVKSIQAAIDLVTPGGGEVWVKAGTYQERVTLPMFVYLYGGFAGTESLRVARATRTNVTIIDGQQAGSVVTCPEGFRLSTIDGFTIRNGLSAFGGGINCTGGSPTISNNIITGNFTSYSGAGLYTEASPLICGNEISNNRALTADGTTGGGIACPMGSALTAGPVITGNTISNNYAGGGGGLWNLYNATITASGNTITQNSASYGGGCHIEAGTLSDNTISGNIASFGGGGISICGGLVTRNTICDNTVDGATPTGGGVICYAGTVSNNVITGNSARSGAGVACLGSGSGGKIVGNVIAKNTGSECGGIYALLTTSVKIINNTIVGGQTDDAGLPVSSGIDCFEASGEISNNIITLFKYGIRKYNSPAPALKNNCMYNPGGTNYQWISQGTGDITADPGLLSISAGDYHLTATSPCINAGLNTASDIPAQDMDGQARIRASIVDIGADESWPAATLPDARVSGNNMPVEVNGVVVTAAFTDHFYVETEDRVAGMRVNKANHGLGIGSKVNVSGVLQTDPSGERAIASPTVVPAGTGSVDPIGMKAGSLGGASWMLNETTGAGQKGIPGSSDLNNIGLLVRVYGRLGSIEAHKFTIQDGSGAAVECITPDSVTVQPDWVYSCVTGISSCKQGTAGLERVLKVRISEDIVSL